MRSSPRRAQPSGLLGRRAQPGGLAAGESASAVVSVPSVCRAPPAARYGLPPPACPGVWAAGWSGDGLRSSGPVPVGEAPTRHSGPHLPGARSSFFASAHGALRCSRCRRRAAWYGGGGGGGLAFAGAGGGDQWSVVSGSAVPRASACWSRSRWTVFPASICLSWHSTFMLLCLHTVCSQDKTVARAARTPIDQRERRVVDENVCRIQ